MALYEVAILFGTLVAETILASVHVRAREQAGHMDASDLIKALQAPCEKGAVHIWKIGKGGSRGADQKARSAAARCGRIGRRLRTGETRLAVSRTLSASRTVNPLADHAGGALQLLGPMCRGRGKIANSPLFYSR